MFGVIPFDPLALTGAMAAGIGGIVMLGSNNSTAKEAEAQLAAGEAARAALIGLIELRVVGDRHAALRGCRSWRSIGRRHGRA